jgi:hypothetical protein
VGRIFLFLVQVCSDSKRRPLGGFFFGRRCKSYFAGSGAITWAAQRKEKVVFRGGFFLFFFVLCILDCITFSETKEVKK